MRSVLGWRMVGAGYRNGSRMAGFTVVALSDGTSRYFPEDVAIGPALAQCRAEGIDTADAQARLDEWVKTGKGVTFDLTE